MKIEDIVASPNLVPKLSDEKLGEISKLVITGYEKDLTSSKKYYTQLDEITKLTALIDEPKNYPMENSSRIKLPTILNAATQYAARVYPELIRNGKIAQIQVLGQDDDGKHDRRAKRVSKYIDYQLLVKTDSWESGTDRLLTLLPIVGTVFRKTYYDGVHNTVESEVLLPKELVVNRNILDFESCRRVSHRIKMHKNEYVSKCRAGLFTEQDLSPYSELDPLIMGKTQDIEQISPDDEDIYEYEFIEQHRYLDLDNDGYEEPYIVTVEYGSQKVVRIVARFTSDDVVYQAGQMDEEGRPMKGRGKIECIYPEQYFTDYHFIVNPDGGFYSIGFGHLMTPITRSSNTIINQLIDAGHFANIQGGFMGRGLRQRAGSMPIPRGQFVQLDFATGDEIRKNIFPLEFKEPSPTLFRLLEFLLEQAKDISSITDIMSGDALPQNSPATTVNTLVSQGSKVFNAINRRIYRSVKKELDKIFRLNYIFGDPQEYETLLDDPEANFQADFNPDDLDIRPSADPNLSSDAQRITKAQVLQQLADSKLGDLINRKEVIIRILQATDTQGIELLLVNNDQPTPEQQKNMAEAKAVQVDAEDKATKAAIMMKELDLKQKQLAMELPLKEAQYEESVARAKQSEALAAQAISEANMPKYAEFAKKIEAKIEQPDLGAPNGTNHGNEAGMEPSPSNAPPQGMPEGVPVQPPDPNGMSGLSPGAAPGG